MSIEQTTGPDGEYLRLEAEILKYVAGEDGTFSDILMSVYAFQRERCEPYAAFCTTLPEPASWRDIPAVPLAAFRQFALRAFPAEQTVQTFRTSGTTGEGYGEHHFCSMALYHAVALAGWAKAGLAAENVVGILPDVVAAPHSSLSRMAAWLVPSDRFYFGKWEALTQVLEGGTEPLTLFGTALAFLDFLEWLGGRKITLPAGSLAVETGGYKGTRRSLPKDELYGMFQSRLGLPANQIWNEYGMTELSSQFYTRGLGAPHYGAPWVRAVVVDPETGQEVQDGGTGVLRIFDLANLGSVSAIQTRDLAVRRAGGFELLGRDPAALPRGCSRAADEILS